MKIKAVVTSRGDQFTSARQGFSVEVKPCPCCGNEKLSVGVQQAMVFGVRCDRLILENRIIVPSGCGLLLAVHIPDERVGKKTLYQVEKETIMKAVEAWNKRAKQPRQSPSYAVELQHESSKKKP